MFPISQPKTNFMCKRSYYNSKLKISISLMMCYDISTKRTVKCSISIQYRENIQISLKKGFIFCSFPVGVVT